jgi:uncharacterized membrane protein YedE/YeeE
LQSVSAWLPAASGFALGAIVGFAVRRARLCSFGAIEDALIGGDGRRMRVFGLALGLAILGTQSLVLTGILDPQATSYVPVALPIMSIVLGSVAFGIGMALVGTCGFGSLVRLGGGDLRGLVVVLVLGAVGYATLRGLFAGLRIGVLESLALPMPDGTGSDLAALTSRAVGIDVRSLVAAIAGVGLCWLALGDRRLLRTPRLLAAGVVLGLAAVAGWAATSLLGDEFDHALRPQSLTFVSTIGKALYGGLLNVAAFADFGVMSIFGVVAGAWLAAWHADELSWEAFDDDREMRRHLAGAALMGAGGILAGGCTIGQGITAGSMLALSWPLAVGGMIVGARVGIALLIGASPRELLQARWTGLFSRKTR